MWRNLEALPKHTGSQWAIWRRGRAVSYDELGALKIALRGWHPTRPVLVASPDSTRFSPPVCFEQIGNLLTGNLRRVTLFRILLWALGACLALSYLMLKPSKLSAALLLFTLTPLVIFSSDYLIYRRKLEWLVDRALFFFWLQTSRAAKVGLVFWVLLGIAYGGIQLFLQYTLGGYEPMMLKYGAMYSSIGNGEYWRLITGPFFHSSAAHFANNFFFLFFIGPLTWALLGGRSVLVFVLGNVASVVAEMNYATAHDAIGGVSGGIFALFGFLIASALFNGKLLPKGFTLICALQAVLALLLAELLSANVASVGHVAGLIFGIISAGIGYSFSNERHLCAGTGR